MTEITKPTVNAFLVCDSVIEDRLMMKKSLIGIFTELQNRTFPFLHRQMGLYFCITDAEGMCTFEITLVHLNTEQIITKAQLPPVEIADRLQISDFAVLLTYVIFPAPGRYEFRLAVNGHLIAQKDINVTRPQVPQQV